MPDIFLYAGEPNPPDVRLRDPTQGGLVVVYGSATPTAISGLTATGMAIMNGVASLSSTSGLTSTGTLIMDGTATLHATGAMVASGLALVDGTVNLSATALLSATGTAVAPIPPPPPPPPPPATRFTDHYQPDFEDNGWRTLKPRRGNRSPFPEPRVVYGEALLSVTFTLKATGEAFDPDEDDLATLLLALSEQVFELEEVTVTH